MHRLTDFDIELIHLVLGDDIVLVPLIMNIAEKASAVYNATVELCNGLVSKVKLYQVGAMLLLSTGAHSLRIPLTDWLKSGAIRTITIEGG